MIEIKTDNEDKKGFDLTVKIIGNGEVVGQQLVQALDKIYEYTPELFELALLHCRYTKDHT